MINHKWTIQLKTLKFFIVQIAIYLFVSIIIAVISGNYVNDQIFVLCHLSIIVFFVETVVYKVFLGNLISPVYLFAVCLYLFTFGQAILHGWNVPIDSFDVFDRLDSNSMLLSLRFSISGYVVFVTGSIFGGLKKNEERISYHKRMIDNDKIKTWGIIFLVIGTVPFLFTLFNNFMVVMTGGYNAYYLEGARLGNAIGFFSYYFYTGLFLLISVETKDRKKILYTVVLIIIAIYFLCGDRGTAISLMLSLFLIINIFTENKKKAYILFGVIVLIAMISVPIISEWRQLANGGVSIFTVGREALTTNNFVFSTLTNLGGTIYALGKTINLVPATYSFTHGLSYLSAFILIIPSRLRFGFGELGTNVLYTSPGTWLMKALGISYGPGFTPFAEAYLNFGNAGILMMGLIGFFFTKIMSINYFPTNKVTTACMQILCFFLFVMAARGSFNYVIAFYIRYVIIPVLCIKYVALPFAQRTDKVGA